MKPQLEEQLSKMLKFANNAFEIAKDITLDKLSTDIPYQYSLLYPLGQIGELAPQKSTTFKKKVVGDF